MSEPGFHRPPTAQEAVLGELRKAIVTGALRPGEQIRQDELAGRFGVSRVPLREALKILEGEGAVRYVPHRGYFVTELSVPDLVEVYRIRELLEGEAVRCALPLSAVDQDRLAAAVLRCEQAAARGRVEAMTAANRRLHFVLFEAAGRPRLARMIRILWDATDAYRSVYYATSANRERVNAEHRLLLQAVRRGDPDLVIRVLGEHRDHAVAHLRTELAGSDEAAEADEAGRLQ